MEAQLVADTNLFFECKALEQLPWSELGYDPVTILLTKPVLDEIDKHKKANGRTRARALEIFGRVRSMLTSMSQEVEIQTTLPKVVLRRMTNVTPDPALKEQLDYTKTDERLIGIASTLNAQASGYRVMLFTDDTGPASTADGLAVPYLMINESWRRPPAESTEEKRIRELEKDLATYRAQEPDIFIKPCEPADANNLVEAVCKVATPLNEPEISNCLAALRKKHPFKTDFTPPAASTTTDAAGTTMTTYVSPPSDQIAMYRDTQYPQWIERCRSALAGLQTGRDEDAPPIVLRWSMSNNGTRPASQVRVEFEAKGPLVIRRLKPMRDHAEDDDADTAAVVVKTPPSASLPSPPQPPAFLKQVSQIESPRSREIASALAFAKIPGFPLTDPIVANALGLLSQNPFHGHFTALDAIKATSGIDDMFKAHNMFKAHDMFKAQAMPVMPMHRMLSPNALIPKPHEPESFYFDWPASGPVKKGALTCDLWRHQTDDEVFEFEVLFTKEGEARGVIECTVHAENLTKPEQAKVIVARTIKPFSLSDLAKAIVEACR